MTQVVILNSGTGSRMGELTADRPKCLVELTGDETILSRQLSLLTEFGLKDIVITTGPYEEMIKAHLKERFDKLRLSYVNNPHYRDTNYIYSMYLLDDAIGEDVILMHGDMIFERVVLEKLVNIEYDDAVLVDPHVELPEKDFKALLEKGRIRQIGVDVFGQQAVSLQPVYKLSSVFFAAWMEEIRRFVEDGNLKVYAENALNNLLGELVLHPVELKEHFCMEVDDERDLEVARAYLTGKGAL